jgi:EAL domain-containing protein (putative c-di-GMP-specific phosphodiesterase class I)
MARAPQSQTPPRRPAGALARVPSADFAGFDLSAAPPRRAAADLTGQATLAPSASWDFVCLVHIANFAVLRRYLGRNRAEVLTHDLVRRVAEILPNATVALVGRATLEVSFSGEDFVDLEAASAALHAATIRPFDIDSEFHAFDILIGAAGAPRGTTEDVRLVEEAEGALEDAHAEHHSVLRDLSAGTAAFDRLTLTRELPLAIASGEMFLQYQPKVHVRKQQISSAEALVRWQHPTRGLILPGDFITVAEEARQIFALTLWTIDEVIRDQKRLAADGHDLTIFINISGQLLGDKRFVEAACAKVHEGGVKIGFEITETAVIRDPECAIANLQEFADQGIVIAIDDYGAGLSSLAYLKQLPARELKIDKMFVLQLTSSNRDPLIVRSTIDLAHALDMEVTAEGVETQAAMALLSVMGCDMIQGYLISRPVSIDAFRHFLDEYRTRPAEDTRQSMFKRPAAFWQSA